MSYFYFLPIKRKILVEKYKSILDISLENDILIEHNCGGNCACLSCIIYVKRGISKFNKVSNKEKYQLKKAKKIKRGYRLACKSYLVKESYRDIVIYLNK